LPLRPLNVDDPGSNPALERAGHQSSESTGGRIEITADDLPNELPEEHKVCIFRIMQEALNNVCRHARASAVEIRVLAHGDQISVIIRDDGRGFRTPRRTGLGLIGMQERVQSLGGRLTVNSEPGKGATIEASLPLPQRVAAGSPTAAGAMRSASAIGLEPLCRDD